jgi:nitrate reductase NapE component
MYHFVVLVILVLLAYIYLICCVPQNKCTLQIIKSFYKSICFVVRPLLKRIIFVIDKIRAFVNSSTSSYFFLVFICTFVLLFILVEFFDIHFLLGEQLLCESADVVDTHKDDSDSDSRTPNNRRRGSINIVFFVFCLFLLLFGGIGFLVWLDYVRTEIRTVTNKSMTAGWRMKGCAKHVTVNDDCPDCYVRECIIEESVKFTNSNPDNLEEY